MLWIHDIPHEPKYCFTQTWGQEEDQDTSVWIEIKKFPEPELPKISPKCTDWIKWETLSGHEARRHVIIAKASLEFEPHLGKFTVKQAVDGDLVDIELDMLDVQDQPQNVRQLVETGRESIGANLWSRPDIDSVLSSVANSLADSGQGEYHPDRMKPEQRSLTSR